jgi:hypothetical protein
MSVLCPIVLQKSQKPQLLNSRQRTPLDRAANPLPESPVSLACGDVSHGLSGFLGSISKPTPLQVGQVTASTSGWLKPQPCS